MKITLPVRPADRRLQPLPGLSQHVAQLLLDLIEYRLVADQRRRELDHRVAAIVGAAVDARLEQRSGQEAPQQPFALAVVERLLGGLVPDQLDAVEEAFAADI